MPCRADRCIQGRIKPCPRRRVCFPDLEADEPAATPEEAAIWAEFAETVFWWLLGILAIVCAVMAALHFFLRN